MKVFYFLLIIWLVTGFAHGSKYECSSRKPCTIRDVVLVSEVDLQEVILPDISDPLIIASGNIPHFTRQLAEKLDRIVDLTINRVECETLFIRPEMIHLEATNNRIRSLLVDDSVVERGYGLISLNLTNNALIDVDVVSRFTKLRLLTLDGNELELLSMDSFARLSDLRQLSIANNKLHTVETSGQFQLDKLQYLSLAGNQLFELNVEKWELASLGELDLANNKLYLIGGSLEQFKRLKAARIAGNYWKCEQLMIMFRLSSAVLSDKDSPDRCNIEGLTVVHGICCEKDALKILAGSEPDLFSDKWDQLQNLSQVVQEISVAFDEHRKEADKEAVTKESSVEKRFAMIEDQIKKLDKQIAEKESQVALNETNELKSILTFHRNDISGIAKKQSELSDELESVVDRLNSMRETLETRFTALTEFVEKTNKMGTVVTSGSKPEQLSQVEAKIKQLENQQLKYHLSSVDLKSQINTERGRVNDVLKQFHTMTRETELLRNQVNLAQERISMMTRILDEIAIIDE
ncbi:uncharacterized protein LOC131438611 [Malaya genurostris]|uniref:uncharacterized protein LOC131438611 n=1 Tax=Malaya genurostris TaxID=325434 RepID=UPI0026F3F881|nr:uncharacterized protein LOC131438611 [Malaya genurostris]